MRIAVQGIVAEGAGSGAGSFPLLLAALLESGQRVEFFGNPNYVHPRSLERFAGYRFWPLRVDAVESLYRTFEKTKAPYPGAVLAQIAHVAYQRAATKLIERLHQQNPYDLILCTDVQALWPSRLPMVSWPQSPPQTEAAALRDDPARQLALRSWGRPHYAAVQSFYAYKALLARTTLGFSDVYLCSTRWARDEWIRFGANPDGIRMLPYVLDLSGFDVATEPPRCDAPTMLWLGRATPRKRLDLFLGAFEILRSRQPSLRARLVGNLRTEPFAASILADYAGTPGLTVEDPLPRERVPELLASVDVVVQPSQNENFGFSLAEALAAGRAVVAGPTNGTLDYAGVAGFAFSEYTPHSVAAAIERALAAVRADGAEISRLARESARRFAPGAVASEFCRIADELSAKPKP